jgi:DNA replication initiation complex subunit (GINS family)
VTSQVIKKIFIGICELREKKIVKTTLSKARGGKPDLKNMLDEEKKSFDSTLDVLMQTCIKLFGED